MNNFKTADKLMEKTAGYPKANFTFLPANFNIV